MVFRPLASLVAACMLAVEQERKRMPIEKLRIIGRISFWAAGLMGAASGALGVIGLALASGICGVLAAVAGMVGGAAANRTAKLELEALRGEAIAFAVAL